jgi:replicative DNA helicase
VDQLVTLTQNGNGRSPVLDPLTADTAEALLQRKLEPVDAVGTFLPSWSQACRDEGGRVGPAAGWMDTAAGGSGKGKSLLGANQGVHALESGWSVAIHSAEMSQSQLFTRTLAIGSGEPIRLLEHGRNLDPDAHRRAGRAFDEIRERTGASLYANRRQLHDLRALADSIRRAHDDMGCRFHVVDYLQLYAVDQNDPASITAVSHLAMRMAQELNVVVLALSQFNRSTSANPDRPSIHGLLGGSAIENDSDQVLLLDHSRIERAPAPAEGWHTYVLLEKNRHGPHVDIPVHFDTTTLRIRERLPDELPARAK